MKNARCTATPLAVLTACLLAPAAGYAAPASYKIDDDHTYVGFEIDHFGASINRARFDKESGTVTLDRAAKTGSVDITVQVNSIYSGSAAFDKHLKSPDLFHAEKYPAMRFVSNRFSFSGKQLRAVHGQLTLLGQTHPVTLKAKQFNCYDSPIYKTETCGGDFEATIDRTQWGMDYLVNMGMPKKVRITATIEAIRQ